MATKKKKRINFRLIFALIINIVLIASGGYLVSYIIKLNDIENTLRLLFSILFCIVMLLLVIFNLKFSSKSKKIKYGFSILFTLLIIAVSIFANYNLSKVFTTLNKLTSKNETVSISLVTLKSNNIASAEKVPKKEKIASVSSEIVSQIDELTSGFFKKYNIINEISYYDGYLEIFSDLFEGKVKYAFLPVDYETILSSHEKYSGDGDKLKSLASYEIKQKTEETKQKSVLEPFTVLLMGVDTLSSSYNADTLLVVTFNPKTLSATMLSIPRDTYTTIACTNKKHKINSSGWSGDKCVIKTVESYIGIDIDYYFKVNFKGVVELVDLLGGVEVDVPYSFCEQNSSRKWGKNTIYVDKGVHKLNGEQALALTRNRHYWPNKCSKKYTTEGVRSDFTRGQNQQLVFKAMLNEVKKINDINTIYKMLDSLGNNMVTNMSTDTILSLYNVGKEILIKMNSGDRDISQLINIQKLKFTSYTKTIRVGNLNLSMVINHDNSVKVVTDAMKVNLGLKEAKVIKTFEFDINNGYEEMVIGSKVYGGSIIDTDDNEALLPNFVSKTADYVEEWCNKNNVKLRIQYKNVTSARYSDGEVLSQTIKPNTRISSIKTLSITVAKVTEEIEKDEQQKPVKETFTYKKCLEESYKTDSRCLVSNYVGKDLSVFKSWINKINLGLKVDYIENSKSDKPANTIISQNISGVSIYELNNSGNVLEITYSTKEE